MLADAPRMAALCLGEWFLPLQMKHSLTLDRSLHESTPEQLAPFSSSLPLSIPASFYIALEALKAFTHCVTPQNPSLPRHTALAAVFTINLQGTLLGADIKLSTSGIDTQRGLLDVPAQPGYRAFDAFYYLNSSSASHMEREFLDLKHPSEYYLLNRSGTFAPPAYLPDADDAAAAEDWRNNLKSIGIKGQKLTNLISCLAGLLKLGDTLNYFADEESFAAIYEECGTLLDVAPELLKQQFNDKEREVVIAGLYEGLVDYVIAHANATITEDINNARANFPSDGSDAGPGTPPSEDDAGDIVNITVVEIPSHDLGKAVALRTVFDDNDGINAEMKEDGVQVPMAGSSVLEGMRQATQACEADLGVDGHALRQQHTDREKREELLETIALEITDPANFVKTVLNPVHGQGIVLGKHNRMDLANVVASSRVWFHLSLHPCEATPEKIAQDANTVWSAAAVSRQLRDWRLPEWANRRNRSLDFTADFDHHEFFERYHALGCMDGQDGIQNWIIERGWSNGEVVVGHQRVWVREGTWWEAESQLDLKAQEMSGANMLGNMVGAGGLESGYSAATPGMGSDFFPPLPEMTPQDSQTHLLQHRQSSLTLGARSAVARSVAPTTAPTFQHRPGDYGLGAKGDEDKGVTYYDAESGGNMVITEAPISTTRRLWVAFVWAVTFWIPSPLLKYVGRMKRPDVRMAWREKVVLVLGILLLNATIVFYIIAFGKLLCPQKLKVWDRKEVSQHQGANDYFVSHHGSVYDLTSFYKRDHSDGQTKTSSENMLPLAGLDMDPYIAPPLYIACPRLVTDSIVTIMPNVSMENYHPEAQHVSGNMSNVGSEALKNDRWYDKTFLPKIKEFRKGDLVWDVKTIEDEGANSDHYWFRLGNKVYDLNPYFYTQQMNLNNPKFKYLDSKLEEMVQSYAGSDLTDRFNRLNATTVRDNLICLENAFYVGITDFRNTPRCKVNDYILLAVTIILCTVIVVKFLAALQLGSKRRPANQDKFVICQVPAYTEGEDHIRKGLDSLTALAYDNKRKLICVICDGMIVGGGNDRPTPKIVLDILGVDPKVDPPALPFKSVGQGSEQLNYGKVYSGLYEFEGNVVPYIVVVKMGKESEQTKAKPGNRGKRDSQILLMSFLNRVHHRSAMNPLELEMFHQINNIIGVDPELYEYLFMVDADTMVQPESLNRLVASCANDSKIAGICGETSLENEERSWWTMIQVYEYYISHHLAKAFESLFGSVTCLPGW
jgi:chitin synthase